MIDNAFSLPQYIYIFAPFRWDVGNAQIGFALPKTSPNTGYPAMAPAPHVTCPSDSRQKACLGALSPPPVPSPPMLSPPLGSKRKTYIVELANNGGFSIPIILGVSGSDSRPSAYEVTADTGSGIVDVLCTCCSNSSSISPGVYNPLASSTYRPPSPSACVKFEGGNSSCNWSYTYHPSMETIGGVIVKDTLTLSTAYPPLKLPALMGCILEEPASAQQQILCNPDSCAKGLRPEGAFGGLDRSASSIISQVTLKNVLSWLRYST